MIQTGHEKVIPPNNEGVYSREYALSALIDDKINQNVWNKLYVSQLWDSIRFPEGHVYEDIDTTYRIIDKSNLVCIVDEALYMYRKRPDSITDKRSSKERYDCALACSHFEAFIETHTPQIFTDKQLKKIRQIRCYQMFSIYGHQFTQRETDQLICNQELRKQIIKKGKDIRIREYPQTIRIAYYAICYCPRLFGVFFPFCNSVYRYYKRCLSRRKCLGKH